MKVNRQGFYRTVLLIGDFTFKFPTLNNHNSFLFGCYANWSERRLWKNSNIYGIDLKPKLCPSYFCLWFGLLQIQARCQPKLKNLSEEEKEYFKGVTTDIKKENFGYYKNKLVCLDYA